MSKTNIVSAGNMIFEVTQADVSAGCTRVSMKSKGPEGSDTGTNLTMGIEATQESPDYQSNIVFESPFAQGQEQKFLDTFCGWCAALRKEELNSPLCDSLCPPQPLPVPGPLQVTFQIRTIVMDGIQNVEAIGHVGGIPLTITGSSKGKGRAARADVEIISPVMATIGADGNFLGMVDYIRATKDRQKGVIYKTAVTKADGTKIMDMVKPGVLTDVCGMPVPLNFPNAGTVAGPLFDSAIAAATLELREKLLYSGLVGFNANIIALAAARKCNNEIFNVFGASFTCILGVVAAGIASGATGGVATPAMAAAAVLCVGAQAGALIKELLVHAGVID